MSRMKNVPVRSGPEPDWWGDAAMVVVVAVFGALVALAAMH